MTLPDRRKQMQAFIEQAVHQGARRKVACECLGLSIRTLQRWQRSADGVDQRQQVQRVPHNKLCETETEKVMDVMNQPAYASLSPHQIVPKLADQGQYLVSEATMYRILRQAKQLQHRQSSQPCRHHRPREYKATGPNQVYSWDITYLPTAIRGSFFYLYLYLDIFSRKIVGWQIHESECSHHAAMILEDVCHQQGVQADQVVLHSDNGSPMKGSTMLAKMQQLGVIPSFSRPHVSDDNPYVESFFRTLKYVPRYPGVFNDLGAARTYMHGFVQWYNDEHQHSAIRFVTPSQRHAGIDCAILKKRKQVYEKAKAQHPERWSGDTRNWNRIDVVFLNPDKMKYPNPARAVAA